MNHNSSEHRSLYPVGAHLACALGIHPRMTPQGAGKLRPYWLRLPLAKRY